VTSAAYILLVFYPCSNKSLIAVLLPQSSQDIVTRSFLPRALLYMKLFPVSQRLITLHTFMSVQNLSFTEYCEKHSDY